MSLLLGLNETIRVKFLEYIRENSHQLNESQMGALQRYADNPEIMNHFSDTLYDSFLKDPDRTTLNNQCRLYIQEIIRVYE